MSDDTPTPEKKTRKPRNKVAAQKRTGRAGSKYVAPDRDRKPPEARFLTPMMIHTLDAFLDPECATMEDVAAKSGIQVKTIQRWIISHSIYREEFWRRVRTQADGLARLGIAGFEVALTWAIKVVRDETDKYGFDEKYRAAKLLIDSQRVKVELSAVLQTVTNNHLHVNQPAAVPAPTSVDTPEAIPSVRRLMATMPADQALRMDAEEMLLIAEQMLVGEGVARGEAGIVDGECVRVEAPRGDS